MAGIMKPPGNFTLTPHKVSLCILVQVYSPPAQISFPFPFSSVAQHNRLGLFLFALTKSCDDFVEPKLDELVAQLREITDLLNNWLVDHLTRRLSALSYPDDLFNFFNDLRGILGGSHSSVLDDDQIMLDPSSNLGMFVRRCLLTFDLLSFEGVCHLLTNVETYCKQSLSNPPYDLSNVDDPGDDHQTSIEYENMDLENFGFEKVTKKIEARGMANKRSPFHNRVSEAPIGLDEDFDKSPFPSVKHIDWPREVRTCSTSSKDKPRAIEPQGVFFLRTNWQIQGYLSEQADLIEKHGSSFSLNAFESILKQLQKLAPELHRVHFLRYLNSLYHDDYPAALEHLHRYFDYSAGSEGIYFDSLPSGSYFGRYQIALVFLGIMQFHFGHPKQALEVLTEAVRVSQQNGDDTCLAYTLAAICNLLLEIGVSNTTGIIGCSYSPAARADKSSSVQQQLYVLLRRSLKRAESLKLKRLLASAHLAIAKFHLMHVQRPLLSFGPKASMKLKACPADVCKELRLSSHLIDEYCDENTPMTIDGALCTAWLKNLNKPIGLLMFSQEAISRTDADTSNFCTQPSSIPGSVMQLIGSSYMVRATAWEIYGSAPLARMNTLVFATCFVNKSSLADAALAYAKLIQHIAVFKGYEEAFSALRIAEEKFSSVSKSRILLVKLQLLHERALHRGHLKLAQLLCDELGVLASPVTGVDMDIKTEASLRHARTLLAANQFSQAAAVAHSLFSLCYKFNLQVENATVLLLLAEIHKRSGNAVLGIPYALASLSFCQSFNLDLLKASATLTLAELWLSLGPDHAKRALALLHSAFPTLLGHGGLELRARAFITEAKCYLADPSFSLSEDPEMVLEPLRQASEGLEFLEVGYISRWLDMFSNVKMSEDPEMVLEPLRQASEGLEFLEYHELASEAYYLMAVLHDKLGQLNEREKAAAAFKKHIVALENPKDDQDPLFNML